ncbi:MAG: NAD(P)H-dependent oxidoreductase subunit E [Nitrospirota bacterium]|nr:NAD(P)H-dependent oxidoreductase subunit E [Nitrospirota bacterium]
MDTFADIRRTPLLTALHQAHARRREISPEARRRLAAEYRLSAAQLDDFISFFPAFSARPEGTFRVCTGPACRLAQGADGPRHLARQLATPGASAAFCLGHCDRAPAVIPAADAEIPTPAPPDTRWLEHYGPDAPRQRLDALLSDLAAAGLCGMGGGGFPAYKKLAALRADPAPDKVLIANADEGEPGTFKDRWLLDHHPGTVLTGLYLACRITGARHALIYLRHEYAAAEPRLVAALHAMEQAGLLRGIGAAADTAHPLLPSIAIVRAGGPYICGEETALIASLEGRRGLPAPGPPYPVDAGLFGHPTLVHNVETLYYLARIGRHGPAWYRGDGNGRRHFSASGPVRRPGIYELPAHSSARQVLEAAGGLVDNRGVAAFIPGGGSSGLLPATALDVPLTATALAPWGAGPGTGGMVFLPRGACVVDMAAHLAEFLAAESCGQCDPCRLGTRHQARALDALCRGTSQNTPLDPAPLADTAIALRQLSICGLGRFAPTVVETLLRHFSTEVAAHGRGECAAGVCPTAAGARNTGDGA